MDRVLDEELKIKKMLRRTWSVFFARHGRLFPIQIKTIPYVLANRNVLIKSPTGSGKTEAVIAPLIERLLEENWQPLSILYIVPTRALANDTIKRLQTPVEMLDLSISRKTGDFPYEFKTKNPSSILVTTPESLDSLLCRQSKIFKTLRAIILDELHLLDNTIRGDQLIFLLERLRGLYKDASKIQYCAMSATFTKGASQGLRYFNPVEVIADDSKKKINVSLFSYNSPNDWKIILPKVAELGFRKIIIFCNSRNEVERIAREANVAPFKDKVWTHHGSLTKAERELVEEIINERRTGICVATMTLEFGIDIGDIDAIILYRPPNSISSLIQRIGRGSRRLKDTINAFAVYTNEFEKSLFEVLFESAAEGEMDDIFYYIRYSMIVQQLLSILYVRDTKGISVDEFTELINNVFKRVIDSISSCADIQSKDLYIYKEAHYSVNAILNSLSEKNIIKIQNNIIFASDRAVNLFASPFLHSNIGISSENLLEVKYIDETRDIGVINKQSILEGETFTLAGKSWKVVSSDAKSIYVQKYNNDKEINIKKFNYYGYPDLSYKVAQALKRKSFPQLGKCEFGLYKINDFNCLIFHFLGSLYGKLLELAYRMKYKVRIKDAFGIYFVLYGDDLFPFKLDNYDINKCVNKYYKTLSKHMNLGRYYNYLPVMLQRQNIIEGLRSEFLVKYLDNVVIHSMDYNN